MGADSEPSDLIPRSIHRPTIRKSKLSPIQINWNVGFIERNLTRLENYGLPPKVRCTNSRFEKEGLVSKTVLPVAQSVWMGSEIYINSRVRWAASVWKTFHRG